MNERIKKLAEQCQLKSYGINGELLDVDFDEEKFAELIVRECATWVNDNLGMVSEEARADLLKHFGVQE
jgi:hypothetical protein